MSDHASTRPRRPPPPPPALPSRPPPPPPALRGTAPPVAGRTGQAPVDPGQRREWRPQPWPTLMRDAVGRVEGFPVLEPDHHEQLLTRQGAWAGMLSWGFGVMVLLLVVAPTTAIPKLLGPFATPVSGAAFGPVVALFAMLSIVVAVGGGLWLWLAMGRDYQADDTAPPAV